MTEQTQHQKVTEILERCRRHGTRVRLYYGDVETGRDWGEFNDVAGRIGRSMGPVKILILLHNASSIGGSGILDQCIVRIRYANRKNGGNLYLHPKYHTTEE